MRENFYSEKCRLPHDHYKHKKFYEIIIGMDEERHREQVLPDFIATKVMNGM